MSEQEWDAAISKHPQADTMVMSIPAQIGRSLAAAGMFRAKIRITAEGILVVPYVSSERRKRQKDAELPDWNKP